MTCVLVVEDEEDMRDTLSFLLRRRGVSVDVAENGQEALEKIDPDAPPCLIITDLMMPVMDGWELRRALEEDPKLAGIPVVVCSGVADLSEKAKSLDVLALLTKPVDLTRLYALVHDHCC